MDAGEGFKIAVGVGGMALIICLFVLAADWLEREWVKLIDGWPTEGDDRRADALVPGSAAERSAPAYQGRCRCRACRRRPIEP